MSATLTDDYELQTSNPVVFDMSVRSEPVTIDITEDLLREEVEVFEIQLEFVDGFAVVGALSTALVFIIDETGIIGYHGDSFGLGGWEIYVLNLPIS